MIYSDKYINLFEDTSSSMENDTSKIRGVIGPDGSITDFRKCDYVIINGKTLEVAPILAYVDNAIYIIKTISQGALDPLINKLPIVYSFGIQTMATDGSHIFINPGFVLYLVDKADDGPDGVIFVILHELYHVLFSHFDREKLYPKTVDKQRANIAMDYEINYAIEHSYPQFAEDIMDIMHINVSDDDIFSKDASGNLIREQWFSGITNTIGGMYNEDYRDLIWEEIYELPELDNVKIPDPADHEMDDVTIEVEMSPDAIQGFKDGVEAARRDLQQQGLIESYLVNSKVLRSYMLNEAKVTKTINIDTYDEGYQMGYERLMSQINSLRGGLPGGGGMGGNQSMPTIKEPKIDMPSIKPKFPPVQINQGSSDDSEINQAEIENHSNNDNQNTGNNGDGNSSSGGSSKDHQDQQTGSSGPSNGSQDDTIEEPTGGSSGSSDSRNPQNSNDPSAANNNTGDLSSKPSNTAQSNSQSTAGGSQSADNTDGSNNQTGPSGNSSSPQLPKAKKVKPTVIGVAKGYDGTEASSVTAGDHIISKEEGEKLVADANYKPGGDDTYVRDSEVFKDKNTLCDVRTTIGRTLIERSNSTGNPGSGIYDRINNKMTELYGSIIDWKKELKKFLKGSLWLPTEGPYNKKRIAATGMYNRISVREGETAKRVLICIDTSGSVMGTQSLFDHFVAEVSDICFTLKAKYVNIIQFCDGVYSDIEISRKDASRLQKTKKTIPIQGPHTGGTSYMPVFKHIENNYRKQRKSFNAVVFLTDGDLYFSPIPKFNDILKYANKIIWTILLNDVSEAEKLAYGKQIVITPKDFNDQLMGFKTNENNNFNMINYRVHKLNEGKFGSYAQKIENHTKAQEQDVASRAYSMPGEHPQYRIHRALRDSIPSSIEYAKNTYSKYSTNPANDTNEFAEIVKWFNKYTNILDVRGHAEYYPIKTAHANADKTFSIAGDLVIKPQGLEASVFPKNLVIDTVEGNLKIFGGAAKHLPYGFPLRVTGNMIVTKLPLLEDFAGFPEKVDGDLIVTMCPNIKSLFGVPKVGSKFFSDNFSYEDYMRYIGELKESVYTSQPKSKMLLEAFSSPTLSRIFKNPANESALRKVKGIPIMWSEIPESCIFLYHNDLRRFLAARRENKTRTYNGFGLYVLCDGNDKINLIFTGNNKRNTKVEDGRDWTGSNGWFYISPGLLDTINERCDLIGNANKDDEAAVKKCIELGIPYSKEDVKRFAYRHIYDTNSFTFPMLHLIPELCEKAYLIIGTDLVDDKTSKTRTDTTDAARDFTYERSEAKRKELKAQRVERIKGILVQGRNLNKNNPMYKRYFDKYFLTDANIIKEFTAYANVYSIKASAEKMIENVNMHVGKIRALIHEKYDNDKISQDIYEALLGYLSKSFKHAFLAHAKNDIDILNDIIAEHKRGHAGDNGTDLDFIATADSAKRRYDNNVSYISNYPASNLYAAPAARNNVGENISAKFVLIYTTLIATLAKIEYILYLAEHGKEEKALEIMMDDRMNL